MIEAGSSAEQAKGVRYWWRTAELRFPAHRMTLHFWRLLVAGVIDHVVPRGGSRPDEVAAAAAALLARATAGRSADGASGLRRSLDSEIPSTSPSISGISNCRVTVACANHKTVSLAL